MITSPTLSRSSDAAAAADRSPRVLRRTAFSMSVRRRYKAAYSMKLPLLQVMFSA
jgi:hypothetical protein